MEYKKLLSRSDDWLKYAINLHLLHEPKETLAELRNATLADSRIQKFLSDVSVFHGTLVTNHKNPDLPIHKLLFLLDLGFGAEVPEINDAIDEMLSNEKYTGNVILLKKSLHSERFLSKKKHSAIISEKTFKAVQLEKGRRSNIVVGEDGVKRKSTKYSSKK